MSQAYDAIVIGAGHNGLVCATYLARGGRKVLVLEAAAQVGGAAITREFAPGYRVSAGAHLLHMMPDRLIRDLDLARHGLRFAANEMPTVSLGADGSHAIMKPDGTLSGTGAGEAAAYAALTTRLSKFARFLAQIFDRAPPRLGGSDWRDLRSLARTGLRLRLLGTRDMREFLRIIGMNVHDLVEETLSTDLVQGALGFEAVLGGAYGPRTPGTVLSLLYRLAGGSAFALPKGGMGSVTSALAGAAKAAGVDIRADTRVTRILVENDRAVGVVLAGGEMIRAATVVSNADPKTTFLKLLGTPYLDTGFVRSVDHIRTRGNAAKLHLALSGRPNFTGLDGTLLGARLLIAPSLAYVEHAYNASKYDEASVAPAIELVIPSLNDASLAPSGGHVLSAVVQYAPYHLKDGWEVGRQDFINRIIATLEAVAPGIGKLVVASELLTPPDLEREFGMQGGHWHHGELAFDQFYMVRPVPGAAQYATPLAGLYLCGAGCHPGGGVMGLAGRNAARVVLGGQA